MVSSIGTGPWVNWNLAFPLATSLTWDAWRTPCMFQERQDWALPWVDARGDLSENESSYSEASAGGNVSARFSAQVTRYSRSASQLTFMPRPGPCGRRTVPRSVSSNFSWNITSLSPATLGL